MNEKTVESETFRCPTCGARQTPAAECRRCKCDLQLVVGLRDEADMLHGMYLRCLEAGEYHQALDCAIRRCQLAPDETARRLLAVAYLHLGRYQAALDILNQLGH